MKILICEVKVTAGFPGEKIPEVSKVFGSDKPAMFRYLEELARQMESEGWQLHRSPNGCLWLASKGTEWLCANCLWHYEQIDDETTESRNGAAIPCEDRTTECGGQSIADKESDFASLCATESSHRPHDYLLWQTCQHPYAIG